MRHYRVGATTSVFGRPFTAYFATLGSQSPIDLIEGEGTVLDHMLRAGELDAAFLDMGRIVRSPDYVLAGGVGLSSMGPCTGVRLVSKVPFAQIRTLATGMTVYAPADLAQLILANVYGARPKVRQMLMSPATMLEHCDACVISGHIGLVFDAHGLLELDIANAWVELTGMPFLWGAWASLGSMDEDLAFHLRDAANWIEAHIGETIHHAASPYPDATAKIATFIVRGIEYGLTPRHLASVKLYAQCLEKLGIGDNLTVPQVVEARQPASVWRKRE